MYKDTVGYESLKLGVISSSGWEWVREGNSDGDLQESVYPSLIGSAGGFVDDVINEVGVEVSGLDELLVV